MQVPQVAFQFQRSTPRKSPSRTRANGSNIGVSRCPTVIVGRRELNPPHTRFAVPAHPLDATRRGIRLPVRVIANPLCRLKERQHPKNESPLWGGRRSSAYPPFLFRSIESCCTDGSARKVPHSVSILPEYSPAVNSVRHWSSFPWPQTLTTHDAPRPSRCLAASKCARAT